MSLKELLLLITLPLLLLAPVKDSRFSRFVSSVKESLTPSFVVVEKEPAQKAPSEVISSEAVSGAASTEVVSEIVTAVAPVVTETVATAPVATTEEIIDTAGEDIGVVYVGNSLEFMYDQARDGYVLIGGTQYSGELYIPDYVDGKPVIEIGSYAFCDNDALTGGLYLPSTIKKIGEYAFSGCSGLDGTLVLPTELEELGAHAFEGVTLSGDIFLPSTLKSVGSCAFRNAGFDGSLYLNDGLKSIGDYAFAGASKLSGDVFIPASVTSIGSGVFNNCTNLEGIYRISAQGYLEEYGDL